MPCPPRDKFQIGWICALPVEAAAAKEMLDENFGFLEEQDTTDPNIYTLGRIGEHNIVIACLPAGQYGNTAATIVANNMVRTFSKSLRIGLMVGVGGGIPSTTCDIRLGDIVISCPTDTCGGVLQYDMGKVGVDGKFTRVGSLNSPPRSLLAAVSMMRAAELTDDPHYPEYIRQAIGRTRKTQKTFSKPDQQSDRLFQIRYDHPATADNCGVCLREWEVTRSEREDNEPQSHYGIIASGDSVIKHGRTREEIRTQTGALCIEMEAAGLMLDFPCIVIRGICDYSDSHKNKQWQGYAALAAASYTKELLGYIPKGQVSQESLATYVCRSLEDLNRKVKGTNDRLDKAYDQQERYHTEQTARVLTDQQKKCHQVFKISNYEQYKNINPDRVPGTCQWALQSPAYLRWWNSCGNDLLWISADPGCGKSVLSKSLIDGDLQASSSAVSICYFFFKDNDEQNSFATALCAILHQLFSQQPSLLRHAVPPWEKNGERLQQEPEELWRILLAATSDPTSPKTICVLDALDECRAVDQNQLIQRLKEFYNQTSLRTPPSWLKFLVTSRPYDEIQNNFKPITDLFPHIHLKGEQENEQIHEEINLVVKVKVKELAETSGLPADVEQRIADQLCQMQHRTYLWLYLAIDDIRNTFQNSLRPANESIVLVPDSVYAAYEKILTRAPSGQKDIVKQILRIIVSARRPLTIKEMSMALGVAANPELTIAAAARLEPTRLSTKIRQLCGLFVFINKSRIYLIHQTAREFLLGRNIIHEPISEYSFELQDADKEMSQICIRYLQMDDLEDHRQQTEFDIQCFLPYSAVYWADHVRGMSSSQQQEIVNLVHSLYCTTTSRHELWFSIFWEAIMPRHRKVRMNAVHLAAFNGHSHVLKLIITTEENTIYAEDSEGATALMWASFKGYCEAVQTLLNNGADVNAQGGSYGNALYAASVSGHGQIVQILLDNGADAKAKGPWFGMARPDGLLGNALQAASYIGYSQVVQILLDKGADVNAQGGLHGNALAAASFSCHGQVVQILLDNGADVDAQGGCFGNALQAASYEGNSQIVQMLLDNGADVNAQGGCFGNALQAASRGHSQIVQILLDNGADVNAQGGFYGNALQAAVSIEHTQIVQILLDKGADINALGGKYGNALQAATIRGYSQIVQILLDMGADVNAQGGEYGNALQAAVSIEHTQIVQILSRYQYSEWKYGNALQAAAYRGNSQMVQILLDKGADVNAQGGFYGNALEAAYSRGCGQIVQMLLNYQLHIDEPPLKRLKSFLGRLMYKILE
ncbi:hypothetical protein BDV36DRAFT_297216 [Aspergillus pseudocaelatus]|uniref:NACHT domain-containing protein n=1 Tax=Aspergillus pseudocaelatus TaxID=1825620 RepID=A0ABQ6WGM7_9EURO|nr:hypothetical protein BDV36DRAFT_297216 [Aspergillus pseudocaelatus]